MRVGNFPTCAQQGDDLLVSLTARRLAITGCTRGSTGGPIHRRNQKGHIMNIYVSAAIAAYAVLLLGQDATAARFVDVAQVPVQSASPGKTSENVQLRIQVAAKAKAREEFTQEQRLCLKTAANPHTCGAAGAQNKPASTAPATPSKNKQR